VHLLIAQTCESKNWKVDGSRITVPLESDRHQVIHVGEYEADGMQFVRVYSLLGPVADVDERRLRAALRLNWTLPYGAVGVASLDGDEGEQLVLVESALASNLSPERVETVIHSLAKTADNYEKFVFGTDDH
jgi:hypothetical protein